MKRATYAEAMAAGRDAADRQMRRARRARWNRRDWRLAVLIVERLLGNNHGSNKT